jgi:uncharacterized protein with ATP-grasp and redox domains
MSHFCLLSDPEHYVGHDRWRFAGDGGGGEYWLNHFADHFTETLRHAEVQYGRAARRQIAAAGEQFGEAIRMLRDDPEALGDGPFDVLQLCRLREKTLRDHGLSDPFGYIKQRENARAMDLYPEVVAKLHALEGRDKWLHLIECVFAGNIFDLGSGPTMHLAGEETDFLAAVENTKPRPWFVDDFDRLSTDLPDAPPAPWAKAVIFIDNAGSDFILGVMPLARELALCGTGIVLAGNERPSLNDITADEAIEVVELLAGRDAELAALIRADMFEVVSTGNDVPLIDLSEVSDELNVTAADAELIVLEGMGRSIESNFDASFGVDAIWLGMLKDEHVAAVIGAELFDCVCKYAPRDDAR